MNEQKPSNLIWVIAGALIVLAVIYAMTRTAPATPPKEEGPIRLGVIAPLTGDAGVYGIEFQKAYDLAAKEINDKGGINGRPLELIYEDGKCDGPTAATAAQKLVNIDKVQAIIGGTCSGETLAAAPITQAARVLLMSSASSSPDVTNAGDLVYRTYPSDAYEAKILADFAMKTMGLSRLAVISEKTDFAQALRKKFESEVLAAGKNIVFDESFDTGETDFRTLLMKLRSAASNMLYIIPQTPQAGELILKQMKEVGVKPVIFAASSMQDKDRIKKNPPLYENMIVAEPVVRDDNIVAQRFLSAFKDAYGESPAFSAYSAAARDAVYLLADAYKSGAKTGEEIAAYLNSVKDFKGSFGNLTFDENGDITADLRVSKAKNGEFVPFE